MEIKIRKGSEEDTADFIDLLKSVRDSMDHKEWFYLDSPEDIYAWMREGIMEIWVAEEDGRIVAALSILRSGLRTMNYGYDLGYSDEDLMRVVNMDTAAVRKEYRGRGLQRKLIQYAEDQLVQDGPAILLCTVHPENRFSLDNVLRQGYTIRKALAKYGSVRYLLGKEV